MLEITGYIAIGVFIGFLAGIFLMCILRLVKVEDIEKTKTSDIYTLNNKTEK